MKTSVFFICLFGFLSLISHDLILLELKRLDSPEQEKQSIFKIPSFPFLDETPLKIPDTSPLNKVNPNNGDSA